MRWQNPMIPTVQTQIRETVARVSRDPIEISTPGTGEQRNRGTEEQRISTPLYPLKIQNRRKTKNRRTSPPQSLKTRMLLSKLLRVPAGLRKPLRFRRNRPRFLRRREKVPKKEKKPATRQTVLAPDWKPSPELRIATAKAGVNLIREVTLFVAYYTQEKPEHRSANWDATYRRWLERDIQNLKMGRDPNNIALHPENLPTNGRLPKSMLNDMHNAEVQARAAAWDEAHPREEEFDEL